MTHTSVAALAATIRRHALLTACVALSFGACANPQSSQQAAVRTHEADQQDAYQHADDTYEPRPQMSDGGEPVATATSASLTAGASPIVTASTVASAAEMPVADGPTPQPVPADEQPADEQPAEVDALHARHGAPTQEALERQMRSVSVATSYSNKKLGERLVIGRWRLDEVSRARVNEDGALDGLVLRFDEGGTVRMQTTLAGDLTVDRGVWALEGMYGPEVRVILTVIGSPPSRERMLFLDIDRFVLSPQDGALTFERMRP